MIEKKGNIWAHYNEGRWVVVSTNIGWKKNSENPMGAGIAKTAAELQPELPAKYGAVCKKYGSKTAVWPYKSGKMILFPTKPLNEEMPWFSWKNDSCYKLIRRSAKQLAKLVEILREDHFIPTVVLPMVGCGNGNLSPKRVIPILEDYLDDDFILMR